MIKKLFAAAIAAGAISVPLGGVASADTGTVTVSVLGVSPEPRNSGKLPARFLIRSQRRRGFRPPAPSAPWEVTCVLLGRP
jgi:hypothetical protein